MTWDDIEISKLPFKKTRQLELLERLSPAQREAMDQQEMQEHLGVIANEIGILYQANLRHTDYEECVAVINQSLKQIGAAFGGEFGAFIVGRAYSAACDAARELFPL